MLERIINYLSRKKCMCEYGCTEMMELKNKFENEEFEDEKLRRTIINEFDSKNTEYYKRGMRILSIISLLRSFQK